MSDKSCLICDNEWVYCRHVSFFSLYKVFYIDDDISNLRAHNDPKDFNKPKGKMKITLLRH